MWTFHTVTGGPHGLISAGRTVLASSPHVEFLDAAFGDVIGRLHYSRVRLWREFGLAMPASAGPSRFTVGSDLAQIGLTVEEMESLGFRIVVDPNTPLLAAYEAMRSIYAELARRVRREPRLR